MAWVPDFKPGDPKSKSCFDCQLDLFRVDPVSTPVLGPKMPQNREQSIKDTHAYMYPGLKSV